MQTGVKIYIASILNVKTVHNFIHFGPVHLGMASHPLTMNNMQEKMSQSFDKNVLVWKNNNRPSSEHKIQTKLLLANPYANIEGQRIVIPQQCKQGRTL